MLYISVTSEALECYSCHSDPACCDGTSTLPKVCEESDSQFGVLYLEKRMMVGTLIIEL